MKPIDLTFAALGLIAHAPLAPQSSSSLPSFLISDRRK